MPICNKIKDRIFVIYLCQSNFILMWSKNRKLETASRLLLDKYKQPWNNKIANSFQLQIFLVLFEWIVRSSDRGDCSMQLQLFHSRINKWRILQWVEILQPYLFSIALFSYILLYYVCVWWLVITNYILIVGIHLFLRFIYIYFIHTKDIFAEMYFQVEIHLFNLERWPKFV